MILFFLSLSPYVRYTREPMGVNCLAGMLPRICKAAGTETIYTIHCLRSTTVQKLSDAGLEARQIMNVTGCECERSLQLYSPPNYDDRRSWSNILASGSGTTNATSAKKRTCPKMHATMPAKRRPNIIEHYFNNCAIIRNIQININKPK